MIRRIGVLTAGGDAPGINPCLKAIVYRAAELGVNVRGLYDGWEGLMGETAPDVLDLEPSAVRTWDRDGGTHLGSSRVNPFRARRGAQKIDASAEVLRNLRALEIDALVVVGGSDSLNVAHKLSERGVPVVGIPKSINKEIGVTEYALGFDTSLRTCADIVERSRTPAGSERWVQVVEVYGQRAGHLALWSGVAGGAQVILIPEHRFRLERLYELIDDRLQRPRVPGVRAPRYATVVVAEGAAPEGGHEITVDTSVDEFGHARLGGIGALLAERIRNDMGCDARSVALGHPQRGGAPSSMDRAMALLFGSAAVQACAAGQFGTMVAANGLLPSARFTMVPLGEVIAANSCVDVARAYDAERYFVRRDFVVG